MRKTLLVPMLGLALISSGCLSTSHRISKAEIMRLSRTAPEQRGRSVRVVQNIGFGESPPAAEPVQSTTVVYVGSPVWIDGRPHHHGYHENSSGTYSSSTGGGTVSGGHHSSTQSNSRGVPIAGNKKEGAKVLLALAALAALGLAATEGARYDGWVGVNPMQPVHLYGRYGGYTVLPLAQIDERTAAWADHGYIRSSEGPFRYLGRAPLNRRGFTYSLLVGAGKVPVRQLNADPGFNGHIQFGYFLSKQVGLNLDIGMGWTQDNLNNTIYISRTSLELQAYLAKAGPLHGGIFGQLGGASRFDDGIGFDDTSGLYGAGGLLQLELTTRLAITGRVGATNSFGEWANEIGIGVSVY